MINIEKLQQYFENDTVFITEHATERFHQRGIRISDIKYAITNGEIIEQYPDDYPFPSCLVLGNDRSGKKIHVCISDEGTASRIITAYYPNVTKWSQDMKIRKET